MYSFKKLNPVTDDQEPFIGKEEGETYADLATNQPKKRSWLFPSFVLLSIVAHLALLLSWKGSLKSLTGDTSMSPRLYTPFHGAIKTKTEIWAPDAWDNSVYSGKPRKELDDAWEKIQAVEGMRVFPEEAKTLNLSSHIRLKNGDQAAIVGYFHNLHCIRYLYQGLHPEVYHRNGISGHAGLAHSHHCIEALRSSILCKPDLTVHAIHWQDDKKIGMTLQPESTRECVDFDSLYEFSKTRAFPRSEIVVTDD
ncbi:hypothetical protein G7Y89_g8740 [Cudoniella acicularis]|uniref:Cyclochlorotine biosynthesis protein O n=1 Tax=Cudoniella acicularis TaxID=354080 RepID=A0A8H4RG22_9HELO|nr:hypothetical protein G7Y89_g8740 [Cudoniella acicularis]